MFLKLYHSFLWSLSGLIACFQKEKSFRLELLLFIFTLFICALCDVLLVHAMILSCIVLLMMAFELINSAIEELCDIISPQKNLRIKYIKDAGSAAVFLIVILYCITWIYIYVTP